MHYGTLAFDKDRDSSVIIAWFDLLILILCLMCIARSRAFADLGCPIHAFHCMLRSLPVRSYAPSLFVVAYVQFRRFRLLL
jgi:hypothetical protein